jgi:glutathionylspermidine synthase
LLETKWEPLEGKRCVDKKTLSREGDNVIILDEQGRDLEKREGLYGTCRSIYQAYAELPSDRDNRLYQAGVFFSYEPCGIGFRREKGIIHNHSQFVGHTVQGGS